MYRQRQAAERLGLEISTRFLSVLEELSVSPESGFCPYVVWDPQEKKPRQLPPQQVAGLFANIRHAYEAMGDWSPLRQLEKQLKDKREEGGLWSYFAGRCVTMLSQAASALRTTQHGSVADEISQFLDEELAKLPPRDP